MGIATTRTMIQATVLTIRPTFALDARCSPLRGSPCGRPWVRHQPLGRHERW